MEQKKSIVRTAIFKREVNTKYGSCYSFEVTFDNGDKGDYLSKSQQQDKFKEGIETEYTIEKRENGQYVNYTIRPIVQNGGNGFVPGKGNPSYEHKRVALRCAVDLCSSGKIPLDKIPDFAGSFMKFLNDQA